MVGIFFEAFIARGAPFPIELVKYSFFKSMLVKKLSRLASSFISLGASPNGKSRIAQIYFAVKHIHSYMAKKTMAKLLFFNTWVCDLATDAFMPTGILLIFNLPIWQKFLRA